MSISELKAEIEKLLARRNEINAQKEWSNVTAHFKAIDDTHDELISKYARLAQLAEETNEYGDASIALANLCSLVADSDAEEALNAARRFRSLPWQATGQVIAHLEDALAIAHAKRGDTIRSKQHRAMALQLRQQASAADGKEEGSGWLWADLVAGLRYFESRQTPPERYAITLADSVSLFEWLADRRAISVEDVAPSIGQFVTNDRGFYREALDRLEMLAGRLRRQLNKPDNYLLVADPGSGKSFFVRQFKEELERRINSNIEFIERNMSAYDSIDSAFFDIIIDVMIALTTHRPVLLFIDEVDTQIDEKNIFQRLIAPMNGDQFFFSQKQISFAKQNLVIFYALSSKIDEIKHDAQMA